MLRYCQQIKTAAKHALDLISAHSNVSLTVVMTVRRVNFIFKDRLQQVLALSAVTAS